MKRVSVPVPDKAAELREKAAALETLRRKSVNAVLSLHSSALRLQLTYVRARAEFINAVDAAIAAGQVRRDDLEESAAKRAEARDDTPIRQAIAEFGDRVQDAKQRGLIDQAAADRLLQGLEI